MADNAEIETEAVEVTEYSTETPVAAAPKAPRAILNVPGAAVGRRKQAIARARLVPGSGKITVNGKRVATTDQLFWAGYSGCFYLPSTVAPMGLTPEGLPAGVQIITRQYGDLTSIRFAELLEKEYGGFIPPPGY